MIDKLTAEEREQGASILKGILSIVFYLVLLNNPKHKSLVMIAKTVCKIFGIDFEEIDKMLEEAEG